MFSSEDCIASAKARFKAWEKVDFIKIDKALIPILKLFNQRPGIGTNWSCEGHFEDKSTFYIMFFCTKSGYSDLMDIYEAIRKELIVQKHPHVYAFTLTLTTRDRYEEDANAVILGLREGWEESGKDLKDSFFSIIEKVLVAKQTI